jgi:Fe-S-cluster containining protein
MNRVLEVQTDLTVLRKAGQQNVEENERFREYLNHWEGPLDEMVMELNHQLTPLIDCTACGNSCRSLMINVSSEEAQHLADSLQKSLAETKTLYLEESMGGQLVMNTIPCHFLENSRCTIYANRFDGCRAFPYLDQPGFHQRIFGILMHYDRCPIIYNMIEYLKVDTTFV